MSEVKGCLLLLGVSEVSFYIRDRWVSLFQECMREYRLEVLISGDDAVCEGARD